MEIKIEKEKLIGNGKKAVVVSLKGRMDTDAAAEFGKEISTLINEGKNSFIINFKELEYISSKGLMVVLSIAKQLKSQKGHVHLSNLNETVKETFEAFKRDRTGMWKKDKMETNTLSHMAQVDKIFVVDAKAKVECKLLDGKSISGQLDRQFRPMEGEIAIRSQGKVHVLPLNHVCCVLFAKTDGEYDPPCMPGETVEDVETRGKEVYTVRVLQQQMDDIVQGFYGILSGKESGISRIFFPKTGIINRSERRPIGEILKAGNVSKDNIQYALDEQQRLRNRKIGEIVAKNYDIPQKMIDDVQNAGRKHDKWKNALIGEILISYGLVTREQIDATVKEQHHGKKKYLGQILIERKIITESELMMALALKFRLRFVDLRDISPNQETLDMVPADIIRRLHIFPVSSDENKFTIATTNPADLTMQDTLRFHTKRWVEMTLATSEQIETYIQQYYVGDGKSDDINIDLEVDAALSEMDIELEDKEQSESLKVEAEAAPVIRLANKILLDGVKAGASDIHLLPEEKGLKVSLRVNGLLQQDLKLDQRIHKSLVARFKIIALMDIAEHRLPQDGRFRIKLKDHDIEFRVSCMPSQYGESLVLRILDKSRRAVGLSQLGLDAKDVESINHIIRSTHGMLLVTGPTGSGKSTTLASVLSDLVDEPKHKLSLEDPIEIEIPGIDQIQIHEKIGFTFAKALRNVLGRDPDIIMV